MRDGSFGDSWDEAIVQGGREAGDIEGKRSRRYCNKGKRKNTTYSAAKDHSLKLSINDRTGQVISRHCSESTRAY